MSTAALTIEANDIGRYASMKLVAAGEALGEDWLIASGRAGLGAILALEGSYAEGEQVLAEAAALAERSGALWSAGWAQVLRAGVILRQARTAPNRSRRGHEAVEALHRAAVWLHHEGDRTVSLLALELSSTALAFAGHAEKAARMRAAAHQHAQQLSAPPDMFHRLDILTGKRYLSDVPEPAEITKAAPENTQMSWPDMVMLLSEARVND